tara:strand:+ start:894 stop:1244 length:351 start_codon:yes stop_codon:yes gene_type:complete
MSDELYTHKIIVDVAKGTNERIELTAEEIAAFKKRDEEREAEKPQRQLAQIRELRNRLLAETDYLATADNTMSDAMKTYRQNLRNVPQDYDASKYDELLEKNPGIGWKHSVWAKPS